MYALKTRKLIDSLNTTRYSRNLDEIYESLSELRPDRLKSTEIIELVEYIEQHSQKRQSSIRHFNSFGTGGDNLKTINISTIASIIASNFVKIHKVGTRAVTSTWGSFDFIEYLRTILTQLPSPLRRRAFYQEGSGYLSLSDDLGYPYSKILREARIKLYKEGIPDIYKVIFPASNLTNSSGQVNGVYSSKYIKYFIDISVTLGRNALVVHSTQGVDEIFSGRNFLIRIFDGKVVENEVCLPDHSIDDSYSRFITESSDLSQQTSKFISILKGDCHPDVILTIAYNVACILSLDFEDMQLESLVEKVIHFMECISNEE